MARAIGALTCGMALSLPGRADSSEPDSTELWDHLDSASELLEVRDLSARFDDTGKRRVLRLAVAPGTSVAWASLPPNAEGWDLSRAKCVQATIRNTGANPADVTLWVASSHGWAAVGDGATLDPDKETTLTCDLRETYPDGTPKIDPGRIREIRVMVQRTRSTSLEVSSLVHQGTIDEWERPAGRLDVPDMTMQEPAPGRRVRYQLSSDEGRNEVYCALYLPSDWEPGKRFPVIAEFPGNLFYHATKCWSTGRPEQCQMGYGITTGEGAIWVSLPFVDLDSGGIAESGFGSRDGADTALHARRFIADICAQWGGDRDNLFLSGFSRGAIACGYIGLSDDEIAGLWKGFVACQHYDGSRWRQSRMEDAIGRAPRFRGSAIFQVDNSREQYGPVEAATDPSVVWTWRTSGLGYHATAMFLDDRPLMIELRRWFRDLAHTAE